jgi:hypothetical protein
VGNRRHSATANSHLFNIYSLLTNTSRVVIDAPTTLMLYAGSVGCEVVWHKNNSFRDAYKIVEIQSDLELLNLMAPEVIDHNSLKDYSDKMLGQESLKSPEELRNLFGWEEGGTRRISFMKKSLLNLLRSPYRFFKSKKADFGYLPSWNSRSVRRHTYRERHDKPTT